MTEITTLHFVAVCAIGCVIILAILAWAHEPECKECPHCKARKRRDEERQRELQHDQDHRWLGYCKDITCPRNSGRPPGAPPKP